MSRVPANEERLLLRRRSTTLLLAQGAVAAPASILLLLADGATRSGYDQLSQPISLLALGERGWTQRGNLLATGLSMLALSEGLRRSHDVAGHRTRWGPRFVAAYGIGLAGAGTFATDPNPTYSPDGESPDTVTGEHMLHWTFSLLAYGALTGACVAYARDFRRSGNGRLAAYSAGTTAALVSGGLLFGRMVAGPPPMARFLGLLQRATIAFGCGWLTVLAVRLIARGRRRGAADWNGDRHSSASDPYPASARASSNWDLYRS